MAVSHETRGTFAEITPLRRLKIRHLIDFIPGVKPYEHNILVEFVPEGASVRMIVDVEPHHVFTPAPGSDVPDAKVRGVTRQFRDRFR